MALLFKIILTTLLLIFSFTSSLAQSVLEGRVKSAKDSTAIHGASVYFDGTSIGVSTNEEGTFRISLQRGTTSALVISSLGYESVLITDHSSYEGKLPVIYLKESTEQLGEVYLETDPWSHEKKLGIFRREFLGNDPAALKCRIKNEEALTLTYIPSKDILIADAEEPLVVINRHLGYEINYNLQDFRVEFSTGSSGLRLTHLVYYEGYSFFRELRRNPTKRMRKNREKAYEGSSLHFLRSLATGRLHENDFRIFHNKFEVAPYEFINTSKSGNLVEVELMQEKLVILFQQLDQSVIQASQPFYIDSFGNHTPPQNLIFGGEMAGERIAKMVPLNYNL